MKKECKRCGCYSSRRFCAYCKRKLRLEYGIELERHQKEIRRMKNELKNRTI